MFNPNKSAVVKAVDKYVEFYNDYRPHQRLGYLTPNKVEDDYYSQNKNHGYIHIDITIAFL
jgi:transposase InsO family protein